MHIKELKESNVNVYLDKTHVGTLSRTAENNVVFAYSSDWLAHGYSISPFSLPLQEGLFVAPPRPHHGLFGVFADSMPDGWGELLFVRHLKEVGVDPESVDMLMRLTFLDATSLGALTYKPSQDVELSDAEENLDILATSALAVLDEEDSAMLDTLFEMGGSSGGARPKVHIKRAGEDWIVKFHTREEGKSAGRSEFEIAQLARACGIEITDCQLLPSKVCEGFFATKRFDRDGKNRVHVLSAAGLLETSHREFSLTYEVLFSALVKLGMGTKSTEELFRRMVFNVAIGNRDDHAKNFAFMYTNDEWHLAPAYDLTQNAGYMGERATTICGKGKNITDADMLSIAEKIGLNSAWAKQTIATIWDIVRSGGYLASAH